MKIIKKAGASLLCLCMTLTLAMAVPAGVLAQTGSDKTEQTEQQKNGQQPAEEQQGDGAQQRTLAECGGRTVHTYIQGGGTDRSDD